MSEERTRKCSYKLYVALSVQSEVCICNKVNVSADRLSTHTNVSKKMSLIVRNVMVRHFDYIHNGPVMMPRF